VATLEAQLHDAVNSECGVERTLVVLKDHWSMLILRDLTDGPSRFNELKRSVAGISSKVLSERLKLLTDYGVAKKEVYPEVPVRVVYSLTAKGKDLGKVIDDIRGWADKWMPPASSP
jgi:DNA-binding HxlR family transcriptional regulator